MAHTWSVKPVSMAGGTLRIELTRQKFCNAKCTRCVNAARCGCDVDRFLPESVVGKAGSGLMLSSSVTPKAQ
jgi:hypothetical protein